MTVALAPGQSEGRQDLRRELLQRTCTTGSAATVGTTSIPSVAAYDDRALAARVTAATVASAPPSRSTSLAAFASDNKAVPASGVAASASSALPVQLSRGTAMFLVGDRSPKLRLVPRELARRQALRLAGLGVVLSVMVEEEEGEVAFR